MVDIGLGRCEHIWDAGLPAGGDGLGRRLHVAGADGLLPGDVGRGGLALSLLASMNNITFFPSKIPGNANHAETETQAKGRMFYISCLQWKENNMAALYTSTVLQWCEI